MRKILYAAMAVLIVLGVAPAGAAELSTDTTIVEDTLDSARTQIPFSVTHTVPGQGVSTAPGTTSTGFVGVCDVQLDCYGFSLALSRTSGSANVGPTSVTIKGVICVRDFAAPCGSASSPGTGVVITQRDIFGPTVSVTIPSVNGRLCVWDGDPRSGGSCPTDAIIEDPGPTTFEINTLRELEVAGLLPDRLIVQTP